MSIIANAQITIVDLSDPILSQTAPPTPTLDMLWLDTSVSPNVLKRWDGSKWVIVNDTTKIQEEIKTKVSQTDFNVVNGKITSLIKESESIRTDFNNLQIGGRNYARNTSNDWSDWFQPKAGTNITVDHWSYIYPPEGRKVGDVFTVSVEIEWETFTFTQDSGNIYFQGSVDNAWSVINIFASKFPRLKSIVTQDNGTTRLEVQTTILYEAVATATRFAFGIRCDYSDGTGRIRIRRLKVEEGNKATSWTPAPEDLENKVTTLTDKYNETVKTVEGNKMTIANVKTTVDNHSNNIKSMDSRITEIKQTADGVSTTVSANKTKWDNASIDATNTKNELASYKMDNLIKNGFGEYGDNTNFKQFFIDGGNTYNNKPSFLRSGTSNTLSLGDDLIPVDVTKEYEFSMNIRSAQTGQKIYLGFASYDIDKKEISSNLCSFISGSTTSLAKELKNGDTIVYLTSVNGFKTTDNQEYQKGLIFWNYKDSTNYQYAPETYSRNRFDNLYDLTKIDNTNNTITLKSAWTKGTFPAGTKVSQTGGNRTWRYFVYNNKELPTSWQAVNYRIKGTMVAPTDNSKFHPATKYIKFIVLANYGDSTTSRQLLVNSVQLRDCSQDLSNLEIGGRNLYYLKDVNLIVKHHMSSYAITDGEISLVANGNDMYFGEVTGVAGTAYQSGYGSLMNVEGSKYITVNISNSAFTKNYYNFYDKSKKTIGRHHSLSKTQAVIEVPNDTVYFVLRVGVPNSVSGTTYKTRVKVEVGNRPTDWTPAIEDIDSSIQNVQTIANQTASKFNWIVKSGTSATDFTLTDRTAQLVADNINLNGRVTFNGLNSDTQTKINNANSTASNALSTANTAKSSIDNLQVGGRNLLLNSNSLPNMSVDSETYKGLRVYKITYDSTQSTYKDLLQINKSSFSSQYVFQNGDEVTLSFYAKADKDGLQTQHYWLPNVYGVTNISDSRTKVPVTTEWKRYEVHWKMGSGKDSTNFTPTMVIGRLQNNVSGDGTLYICGIKFEVGNRATDYSIAPEDTDTRFNGIDSKLSLSQQTIQNGTELFDKRYETDINTRPFQSGAYEVVSSSKLASGIGDGRNVIKTTNYQQCFSNYIPWTYNDYPFYFQVQVYYVDTTDGTVYVQVEFFDENKTLLGTKDIITNATISKANTWQTLTLATSNLLGLTDNRKTKARYIRLRYFPRYNNKTGVTYARGFTWKQLSPTSLGTNINDVAAWQSDKVLTNVTTINGGYLKTGSITTDQLDTKEIYSNKAFISSIQAIELNADMITSGTIYSNMLNLYGMRVLQKDNDTETLSISTNGDITMRGSVESYNFHSGKTGWSIRNDGNAEFNDVTVRGDLIGNYGGIASCGGTGTNLLRETNQGTKRWFLGIGSDGVRTKKAEDMLGVNGVVFDVTTASTQWQYLGYTIDTTLLNNLKPSSKYTVSFDMWSSIAQTKMQVSIKKGDSTKAITNTKQFNISANTWTKFEFTLDTISNPVVDGQILYFLLNLKTQTIKICNLKLEEGEVATPWSAAVEDKLKQIVMWAGSPYEERESAPFRVYSDGSSVANMGTFGGVFTGEVAIGNITIADPSSTGGNDALLTIKNGQNGINKVQLTDANTSRFAQDILITDNQYNTTIQLAQDGIGNFATGIAIGSNVTIKNNSFTMSGNELKTNSTGFEIASPQVTIGSSNDTSLLKTYGNVDVTGKVSISQSLVFGNTVEATITASGIDFDYIK